MIYLLFPNPLPFGEQPEIYGFLHCLKRYLYNGIVTSTNANNRFIYPTVGLYTDNDNTIIIIVNFLTANRDSFSEKSLQLWLDAKITDFCNETHIL